VNTDQVNELYVDLQKEILDCITEDEKELKSEMAVEEADKRKKLFWSSKSDSLRGAYSKFEDGIYAGTHVSEVLISGGFGRVNCGKTEVKVRLN